MTGPTPVSAETLRRFADEQHDLASLCADRPLDSREPFAANDWYGTATVLRRYAGLDDCMPIKAVIPHGIYFDDSRLHGFEQQATLPAALVYEKHRLPLYATRGVLAIPSAAPFCYANRLVERHTEPKGTLFFPAHSSHWLTVDADWEELADLAAGLETPEDPVSVMIYWRDYLLGHHAPFEARGLRVVSAGHMFDPDFQLRQSFLMHSHRRAASNALGSHVYYSTQAGLPMRIIEREYGIKGDQESLDRDVTEFSPARRQRWQDFIDAFSETSDATTERQRGIVGEMLSPDRLLEPEELAELLGWLDRLDRFGPAVGIFGDRPAGARDALGRPSGLPFASKRGLAAVERWLRHVVAETIALARRVFPFLHKVRLRG